MPWSAAPVLYAEHRTALGRTVRVYWLAQHNIDGEYTSNDRIAALADTPAVANVVFLRLGWHRQGFNAVQLAAWRAARCTLVVAANTADERAELTASGVRAVWANHNAFLDERLFAPRRPPFGRAPPPPRHDLLVLSRWDAWKRVDLARAAAASGARVALLGYGKAPPPSWATDGSTPSARVLNPLRDGLALKLSKEEVAGALASTAFGGVFSAREGACFSSMEMLLSGVPLITTPSEGGRDDFFVPDVNCVVAEPTTAGVAAALRAAQARVWDHGAIRRLAVQALAAPRARFAAELQRAYDALGVACAAADEFAWAFTHKCGL